MTTRREASLSDPVRHVPPVPGCSRSLRRRPCRTRCRWRASRARVSPPPGSLSPCCHHLNMRRTWAHRDGQHVYYFGVKPEILVACITLWRQLQGQHWLSTPINIRRCSRYTPVMCVVPAADTIFCVYRPNATATGVEELLFCTAGSPPPRPLHTN